MELPPLPHVEAAPSPEPAAGTSSARGSRFALAPLQCVLLAVLATLVTFLVFKDAWVSDDALITFRYVDNLLHGYGPVFNPGERVQGFTHPLWFLTLTATTALTHDEVYAAVGLGLVLTVATCLLAGSAILYDARDRLAGLIVATAVLATLAISDSWRSFQTSGLEGSLSTLLLVLLVLAVTRPAPRPGVVLALGSLLLLNRADLALLAGPVCLLALLKMAQSKRWLPLAWGALPLAWFAFAFVYYGDPLPNTAANKLGIFTPAEALQQGLTYVADWVRNEPVTAIAAVLLFGGGSACARRSWDYLLLAGIAAYLLYVVAIGGDFMRGRFIMSVLVPVCVYGGLSLARRLEITGRPLRLGLALLFVGALTVGGLKLAPRQERAGRIPASGIVNERLYYFPGYSFAAYMAEGRLVNRYVTDASLDALRAYIDHCGSLTIHLGNPAYTGYVIGPRITVIDMLGLNDRYIAALPNEYLTQRPPRVGHPQKKIPVRYLASRGDVALLPGWRESVRALDCSMPERLGPYRGSDALFDPSKINDTFA
jgi:arabinofuranosyltransferase